MLRVAGSALKDIIKQDAGNELRVVEIAKGRIVFEEKTEKGIETVIVRVEEESYGLRVAGYGVRVKRQ